MEQVFELAGWCAAHAFVTLSKNLASNIPSGEPALLPFLVFEKGEKRLITVFDEASPKAFQDVAVLLDKLSPSDKFAVLVRDGCVTLDKIKTDALILDGHLLSRPRQSFTMVIPYDRPDTTHSFALHKPKLASHSGFELGAVKLDAAFARGRDSNEQGSAIWRSVHRPT